MVTEKIWSLYIYTDGGSRGNPGNAAIAFTIYDAKGKIISEKSKYIGVYTNNISEYRALISALEEASAYCRNEIFCFLDSETVVKQLNGIFRIKQKHLKKLFLEVKNKEKMYKRVTYSYLPRTNPRIAQVDRMLNKELDQLE